MQRRIAIWLATALVATAAGVPAYAARPVKRVCFLARDVAGDALAAFRPNAPGLDLRSADVASDRTYVTIAIRVADLPALASDSPTGAIFRATTLVGPVVTLIFFAIRTPAGDSFRIRWQANGAGGYFDDPRITGTFDEARDEIRITAPVDLVATKAPARPGTVFADLILSSERFVGTVLPHPAPESPAGNERSSHLGVQEDADQGGGSFRYVAGSPSCLRPGS